VASISAIKAFNQARISNETGLEATQAGFEVGTRTIVEVLNAQSELFLARRDYRVARYRYVQSHLQLNRAAGLLSVEDLREINAWFDPPNAGKL
jgi:outer membrane protein